MVLARTTSELVDRARSLLDGRGMVVMVGGLDWWWLMVWTGDVDEVDELVAEDEGFEKMKEDSC